MRAYSEDLRQRVVQACDEGVLSRQEIAEHFAVSLAWIRRLLQRRRETGSFSARPGDRGPKPKLDEVKLQRLTRQVQQHPDATLAELKRRARLSCCLSTIHNALKTLGFSLKKSRSEPASKIATTSARHAAPGPIA